MQIAPPIKTHKAAVSLLKRQTTLDSCEGITRPCIASYSLCASASAAPASAKQQSACAGGELAPVPPHPRLHRGQRGRLAAGLERRRPQVQLPPRPHAHPGRAHGAPGLPTLPSPRTPHPWPMRRSIRTESPYSCSFQLVHLPSSAAVTCASDEDLLGLAPLQC